ncbi:hypothetical protein J2Y46_002601 [Microbacterium sp. BE35]|uniref:SU10 major capsid protein n=1 Tax=Microbacterium sp. BE35 TaxID=2817773 RepID=UPI00285D597D|nr:DUF5309 family protein [Microbacterium sp. BE35]MDR7189775.1 hypothetical protein [Microbacterium sp. BE35]
MAGITGLGTTYNLPNFTGILHQLSPSATPLFSAIGGLNGGGQTTSPEFEWETFDLRTPGQNTQVEGATAPSPVARVRANVTNVTQIHQSKVSIAYSKLGAFGQKSGSNNDQANPIKNELDWQVAQELKQMLLDVEWSFINGIYSKPGSNASARQTRGLIPAITTNVINKASVSYTGGTSATDTITVTHALSVNDAVVFTAVSGAAASVIVPGRVYYVQSISTTVSFKIAATVGGPAITVGTGTGINVRRPQTSATSVDDINSIAQLVFDNGGIQNLDAATLIVNSTQKRAISAAYAGAYGKFVESSRTVGGVNVSTVVTDFGTLNVMVSRHVPADSVVVSSLDLLRPVYLETPGKGHFFAEPLAKTGASEDVQLYGEIGLAYGPETAHGIITGLKV